MASASRASIGAAIWLCLASNLSLAADWPPTLDAKNTNTKSVSGRTIERYTHGPRETWGYPAEASGEWGYPEAQESGKTQQNHNSFYLVAPKQPRDNAPLCVVLHSANRTAYDYLGFGVLDRKIEGGDDPASTMTNAPEDFYALYLSSTNAEWWGWSAARKNIAKKVTGPSPAELRVLDTIEWVATRYHIDRNRIYLCGVSMGGCGTLGIGLPNGNVFAAIRADVPAGTEYAAYRTGGFPAGLADTPVLVDFSSQTDNWSKTQPPLVQAAQANHLPLVLCWGPFGHTTFANRIAKFPICAVALEYPWLEIRKDEAYPVFTHASTDQLSPWAEGATDFDATGQTNAWFRWKAQQDTPARFAMQLWIAHPKVDGLSTMPETATTDVTFRRVKEFHVQAGKTYGWQLVRDGKAIVSGETRADATNLLTIPQVTVTTKTAELVISAMH